MSDESKTTMQIAFDEAKFANTVLTFFTNCYRAHGGDKNKFKGRMIRLLEIACRDVDPDDVSVGHQTFANGQNANAHRSPIEQDQIKSAERPSSLFPAQPNAAGQRAFENQSLNARRANNDQGHSSRAERPAEACPDQPNSMGHSHCAENQVLIAHRTPSNGLDQRQVADKASPAVSKPVRPAEPTQSQINARIIAKQAGARSLFDTVWLGKPIGAWSYRAILAIESDGDFAKSIRTEIGDVAEGDMDRDIIDLLGRSEDRIRKIMMACGRIKSKKDARDAIDH